MLEHSPAGGVSRPTPWSGFGEFFRPAGREPPEPGSGCSSEPVYPLWVSEGVPLDVVHLFPLVSRGFQDFAKRGVPHGDLHVVQALALVRRALYTPCTTCTTK